MSRIHGTYNSVANILENLTEKLNVAKSNALLGSYGDVLELATYGLKNTTNVSLLLDLGRTLLAAGFVSMAGKCFSRCVQIDRSCYPALVNLANVAHAKGEHDIARKIYVQLCDLLRDEAVIRRNSLTCNEYDPTVRCSERFQAAGAWGRWVIAQAGGWRGRMPIPALDNRKLRVGYVSADICQHTVGLLLKDVFLSHDTQRVDVYLYSSGHQKDWVTDSVRPVVSFRDVSALSDVELARQITDDKIDVLVDLSGHTAGSRLTAFAYRPAPVMVSWLGYFATTGLPYIDAVFLDEWHAPQGTEIQFTEEIVRLPYGRFCYQPVSWAPAEVEAPPSIKSGYITFGCFNNTSKLNDSVLLTWARILKNVDRSRLILKWRTFNDEEFKESVWSKFSKLGISRDRIELRGPSFHKDLLFEYNDVDIALDPFPFCGGLTTCESLWMGVPVVTLPMDRVVSRQSHALLNVIGLGELSAKNIDDYIEIATGLALNRGRLSDLRANLRCKMQQSSLMKPEEFTRSLEDHYVALFERIASTLPHNTKKILHVGPGHPKNGARLPPTFQGADWHEIRLDIDPLNEPDVVGSVLDMAQVDSGSIDAIYSAHNIEHVYEHEVGLVLKEFLRVLRPGGWVLLTCPDLQAVCQLVAKDRLTDKVYDSAAGPIRPIDILFGHSQALSDGHHFMAHKTGFTLKSLFQAISDAGFDRTAGKRRPQALDLWVLAVKGAVSDQRLQELAKAYLP